MNKILIICVTYICVMTSCSSSKKIQKMENTNETTVQEVVISDIEKNRIFVTMHASFKNEEKCRIAMETIVNDAHASYGVNSHFWFRSEDGKSLFVLEQYEDKKALRKAVRRFTSARMSFFRSIKDYNISVYGKPSAGSKIMFALFRPPYYKYYGGYSKLINKDQESGIKTFERDRVLIVTNATFKDEEKCKVAMKKLIEDSHTESGTKTQHFFTSKDGKSLFVLEQYENEKALIDHLKVNQNSRAAFFETIKVDDVTIYGTQSDKVKENFATYNPTYMNYYGGYSK